MPLILRNIKALAIVSINHTHWEIDAADPIDHCSGHYSSGGYSTGIDAILFSMSDNLPDWEPIPLESDLGRNYQNHQKEKRISTHNLEQAMNSKEKI